VQLTIGRFIAGLGVGALSGAFYDPQVYMFVMLKCYMLQPLFRKENCIYCRQVLTDGFEIDYTMVRLPQSLCEERCLSYISFRLSSGM